MGSVKKIFKDDSAERARRQQERLAEQQRIKDTNNAIMASQGSAYDSMSGAVNTGGSSVSDVGVRRKRGGRSSSSSLGL